MTATAMPAPDPNDTNGDLMTPDLDEPVPDTLRMESRPRTRRAPRWRGVVCSLGRDELRVLTRIAERLRRRQPRVRPVPPGHRRARVPRKRSPRGDRGRPRLPRVRLAQDRIPEVTDDEDQERSEAHEDPGRPPRRDCQRIQPGKIDTTFPLPPRRTDAALKPKAPLDVLVSRALDQELDWYFAYGEAALYRGDVTILPSYAAVRILATETERDVREKATGLALTVRSCLLSLRVPHASVLRTAYTPRRWPEPIERAFQSAAPIAVRLALAAPKPQNPKTPKPLSMIADIYVF